MFGTRGDNKSLGLFELSEKQAKKSAFIGMWWIVGLIPLVVGLGFLTEKVIAFATSALIFILLGVLLFSRQLSSEESEVPIEWRPFFEELIQHSGFRTEMIHLSTRHPLPSWRNQILTIPKSWIQTWKKEELEWLLVSHILCRARLHKQVSTVIFVIILFLGAATCFFLSASQYTRTSWSVVLVAGLGSMSLQALNFLDFNFSKRSDRMAIQKLGTESGRLSLDRLWKEKKANIMLPITLDDIEKRAKRLGIELAKVERC